MRFRSYAQLRGFCEIARHRSLGRAADSLSLTKGALCHQLDRLEDDLGFAVFTRHPRGIELTAGGRELLRAAEIAFSSIEQTVGHIRRRDRHSITIGMATYFASRWLSPRLMRFISKHAGTGLRIQPMIGTPDLRSSDLDMAIRWGRGDWVEPGMTFELILGCPSVLTASIDIGRRIEDRGIAEVIGDLQLLHDADGSVAWADWFAAAGLALPVAPADLVIPDPNVRVQAVIDGQGVALYDALVDDEVAAGKLYRYDAVRLDRYGYYLVYPDTVPEDSPVLLFRDWILAEAGGGAAA